MRIIGLDPGTAITGFSIVDNDRGKIKLLDYGVIRTASDLSPATRLQQIADDLSTLLQKWQPQQASVEKLFFQKNVRTAMAVSQARGVIIQKLTEGGVNASEYTPLEIKSAVCGNGRADKKMIQQMVKIIFNLAKTPQPDDAADAIAAAVCHANYLKIQSQINEK